MKDRIQISELKEHINKKVTIAGWVHVRRDHGKLVFIDLRDRSGKVQVVFTPKQEEALATANTIRPEWVVEISGSIKKRPDNLINEDVLNGDLELGAENIVVLNESITPIFDVTTDGKDIGEEGRLTYKYLDLRRERLQDNLTARHNITLSVRNFLSERGFIEVETPILTKSTPEGARDYVVPSRIDVGSFYALPQSPQQYKQLLMTAGVEKYFQFARCMRDEDTRGDRQPEFTQMDLEMSFVDQEDVIQLNEELLIHLVETLYPEKEIQEKPFPRMTYKEAMEKYKTDRPDLRKDKEDPNLLAFCWIVDFPFFEKTKEGDWTFTHNPFSMPKKENLDDLMGGKNIENILTSQYDIILNGFEIGGGSIRSHKREILESVFKTLGHKDEDVQKNFGHMLTAFDMGTPPHGGIAWGFDRLVMVLQNEPNIREVIAFPKTGEGRDLMMRSPSEISDKQLKELGITVKKPL